MCFICMRKMYIIIIQTLQMRHIRHKLVHHVVDCSASHKLQYRRQVHWQPSARNPRMSQSYLKVIRVNQIFTSNKALNQLNAGLRTSNLPLNQKNMLHLLLHIPPCGHLKNSCNSKRDH